MKIIAPGIENGAAIALPSHDLAGTVNQTAVSIEDETGVLAAGCRRSSGRNFASSGSEVDGSIQPPA
jgi:hypothetical protein